MSRNDAALPQMDREAINRLEVWIARQSGGRAQVRDISRLSGGAIQENWHLLLDIDGGDWPGSHDLVLRKDAPSGVSVSHGRAEEFALLKAAHKADVAVPTPCVLCEDPDVLGTPFFLMHRAEGSAAGHRLAKAGDNPELVRSLGRNLARIHAITDDPSIAFLDKPDGPPAESLIDGMRADLDALPDPHPVLEWGLSWLAANAPAPETPVLCHRDYRTGNYMVADGALTAILDWEFAAWSDPMEDIGWFTARCWRFGAPDREAGGIGEVEDFLEGYEAESGRIVDRALIGYWQVLATVRWAVIALQQADRFVSGGEQNLELALTAHIVPELEWDVLTATVPADPVPEPEMPPRFPAPSAASLLGIARDIVRGDLVPLLDGDGKYKALMAANAMAIVGRQIEALAMGVAASLQGDVDLARRLRQGRGTAEDHALLTAVTRQTLKLSNPRAL